ncbi:MAG: zf-HC2 domain-containing protein [Ruminococcus sp.]|nr:zf-HC2 domain-containing protein [Ruminococcus sp.]
MNCKIIKDLIPLSEEGLCSEESKAMIEEHIKDCESCRMLCEKMPVDSKSAPVPDEKETFKKVNRKMKKLTWKFWICGVILLAILGGLGYLTFGQITKMNGLHSFETIIQSFEVRKLAKYIADKDFDSFVEAQGHGVEEYIFDYYSLLDSMLEIDKQNLKEAYEKDYGNTKVKKIHVKSQYMQIYSAESYTVANLATIEFEDNRKLEFWFLKETDGLYKLVSASDEMEESDSTFIPALYYLSYHDAKILGTNNFKAEYYDSYIENQEKFLNAGFAEDNLYYSDKFFDEEKNMLYYEVAVEASDDKGSAILTTRLYYDYLGFIPPEKDTINVYTDNCTPELEEALYNFFG